MGPANSPACIADLFTILLRHSKLLAHTCLCYFVSLKRILKNGMFYEKALSHTAALSKGGVSESQTDCLIQLSFYEARS
jgi:hypothetical protein